MVSEIHEGNPTIRWGDMSPKVQVYQSGPTQFFSAIEFKKVKSWVSQLISQWVTRSPIELSGDSQKSFESIWKFITSCMKVLDMWLWSSKHNFCWKIFWIEKKNHFNQSLIKFNCCRKECSLLSKCIEIAIIELNIFIQKYWKHLIIDHKLHRPSKDSQISFQKHFCYVMTLDNRLLYCCVLALV